jgi:hypothetical protein
MGLSFHWWLTRPSSNAYAAMDTSSGGYWLIHIVVPPIGLQIPLAPWLLSLAPPLGPCIPSNSWLCASTSVFARAGHNLTRGSYIRVLSAKSCSAIFLNQPLDLIGFAHDNLWWLPEYKLNPCFKNVTASYWHNKMTLCTCQGLFLLVISMRFLVFTIQSLLFLLFSEASFSYPIFPDNHQSISSNVF